MSELRVMKNNDVPDVSSTGINDSAKTIWQAIQAQPRFDRDTTVGKFRGVPGRYWSGAVNKVINDLWPALNDRYLTEKDQAEELKLSLNRFLRHNQAVVCTRDGGLVKPSMWFIATHWPELTVIPGNKQVNDSPVTDAAATATPTKDVTVATPLDVFNLKRPAAPAPATEERSEEAMTPTFQEPVVDATPDKDDDDVVYHECRLDGCEEKFEGVHHRATHEMRHGFRYNEDGTVTHFDANDPTPDEEQVQALIVKVCDGQEPMNTAQIVEAVRKDTPKASSTTIKIVLEVMTDDKWFELINKVEGQKGRVRKFRFLGEPSKKSRQKPMAKAVDEKLDDLTSEKADAGFIETAVATLRDDRDESRVARYHELFQGLMADLRELDVLREQIKRMEKSHVLVREELARVTQERDDALAKAGNDEELARVTQERDELQGKLDTLKKALGSL